MYSEWDLSVTASLDCAHYLVCSSLEGSTQAAIDSIVYLSVCAGAIPLFVYLHVVFLYEVCETGRREVIRGAQLEKEEGEQ